MSLHKADPRADKPFWCATCQSAHKPTEDHKLCPTGELHLHAAFPEDLYIDFKGWRFRPPFHCMYCGINVCPLQWAFSRSCGGCDVSQSRTARISIFDRRIFSGPHELIDPKDSHFIEAENFVSPTEADRYPVLNPPKPFFPYLGLGCDKPDCVCTCLHTVHPVANHSETCPEFVVASTEV